MQEGNKFPADDWSKKPPLAQDEGQLVTAKTKSRRVAKTRYLSPMLANFCTLLRPCEFANFQPGTNAQRMDSKPCYYSHNHRWMIYLITHIWYAYFYLLFPSSKVAKRTYTTYVLFFCNVCSLQAWDLRNRCQQMKSMRYLNTSCCYRV